MLTPEQIAAVHTRVPAVPLEEYAERYKDYLKLERKDGILIMTMHFQGGSAKWVHGLHNALGCVLKYIGQDKENGVLIITGAGDTWLGGLDPEYMQYMQDHSSTDHFSYSRTTYDDWYVDGHALLQNLLFDIDIPTIAAVNGPTPLGCHSEFALACDLTLASEDANFGETHFVCGLAPGDGQYITLAHLIGEKRANYLAITGKQLTAQQALEWGLVNEVLPKDKVLDRAIELAQSIMTKDYYTRRLAHSIMSKSWRKDIVENFNEQFAMEGWAGAMNMPERHTEREHKG